MGFFSKLFAFHFGEPPESHSTSHALENLREGLYNKLTDKGLMGQITGISAELDEDIRKLRDHIISFNRKLELVNQFLRSKKMKDLQKIRDEAGNIRRLIAVEKNADDSEETYTVKILRTLERERETETDADMQHEEYVMMQKITELKKDIELLQPCLLRQLEFLKLPDSEQSSNIKAFLNYIREEAEIIGYEENIIKDLKNEIEKLEIDAIVDDNSEASGEN